MKFSLNNPIIVGVLAILGAMSLYFNLGIHDMIFPTKVVMDNIIIDREPEVNSNDINISEVPDTTMAYAKTSGYQWETSSIRDPFNFAKKTSPKISQHNSRSKSSKKTYNVIKKDKQYIDHRTYVPIIIVGKQKSFTEINDRVVSEGDLINNRTISRITPSSVEIIGDRDTLIYEYSNGDR